MAGFGRHGAASSAVRFGSFSCFRAGARPAAMDFPHGALGMFRLLEGDAFENTICGAGGEEMTGMVGRVARDNAGGAPGNLDDKSMGHGVC